MKTQFTRRAEAFADALEHAATHGAAGAGAVSAGVAPLVFLTERLYAVPQAPVAMGSAFRDALVAEAAATLAPVVAAPVAPLAPSLPAGPMPGAVLSSAASGAGAQIIAGVLALAVAVTGVGVAADRSLPGDAFYGLKRLVERLQRAGAGSEVAEAAQLAEEAAARVDELRRLLAGGTLTAAAIARVERLLADLTTTLDAALSRLEAAGSVPTAVLDQLTTTWNRLAGLLPSLPESLQRPVLDLLTSVNNRLGALVDGASPVNGGVPHTPAPVETPSGAPTPAPTAVPTTLPTSLPTTLPTTLPTSLPTTPTPTSFPTALPTAAPSPSLAPLLDLPFGLGPVYAPRIVLGRPASPPAASTEGQARAAEVRQSR